MSRPDPLRRTLLAIFLLIAVAFAALLGAVAYGLLGQQSLSAQADQAAEALLAAGRLRQGQTDVFLPSTPGREALELALVRGEAQALNRALARYEQSALQELLDVERERTRLSGLQASGAGVLMVLTLAALVALLIAMQRLILHPIESLDTLARRVLEGDLAHRAPRQSQPEFDRLGGSMNAMLDSLDLRLAELERSRRNLEDLVAATPTALVEVDPEGRVVTSNPAARELVGHDLDGQPAREALPIQDPEGRSLWDHPPEPERTRWLLRGEVPVTPTRVLLTEREGALVQIQDLRPEENLERLRRETLSVVYRELRAPLARILEVAEASGQEDLAFLARHVMEMAENLTLADSLRRGRWTVRRELFDLGALLAQAARAHEVPAREREVMLECRAEEATMVGDPARMRLVVHHLLGRTLESSRPGGKISASCRRSRDRVVLELIPDEVTQASRVRDWLLRSGASSASQKDPGLLDPEGRSLVHQILLAHQATVEPGPADRIRVLLPAGRAEEAGAAREMAVEPEAAPPEEEKVSAAALESDARYAEWLSTTLGVPVAAHTADLPRHGLEALLVDLDTCPAVLRSDLPEAPVLALAARPTEVLDRFLELRAAGLVGRDESAASLRGALRRVARGETVLSPAAAEALLERASRARGSRVPDEFRALTGREQEIFVEIARGRNNREIADLLFISEGTVKTHVNNLLRKLDLRDRVQLLLYAAKHDLLPEE